VIRRLPVLICTLVALSLMAASMLALPQAPQEPPPAPVAQRPRGPATPQETLPVAITVGRGRLVQFTDEASRVSVSDPAVADAVVVSPHEVVLNGKSAGRPS
jgi:Flp pilus assembly secretin CpaC